MKRTQSHAASIEWPAVDLAIGGRAGPASIYQTLRQMIVTLRVRPGERLSENEIALRFGTSRAPVREALIRLVEDGLIDVRPQRGSFVTRISLRATHRARFVREALEVAIVRHAAIVGLDDEAIATIAGMIDEQEKSRDDAERFTHFDDLFHRSLAEVADQTSVWALIEREKVQFDRIRFLSLASATPHSVLIAQHRAVLAGIAAHDPMSAEAAMRSHLGEVLKITGDLIASFPDLILSDL